MRRSLLRTIWRKRLEPPISGRTPAIASSPVPSTSRIWSKASINSRPRSANSVLPAADKTAETNGSENAPRSLATPKYIGTSDDLAATVLPATMPTAIQRLLKFEHHPVVRRRRVDCGQDPAHLGGELVGFPLIAVSLPRTREASSIEFTNCPPMGSPPRVLPASPSCERCDKRVARVLQLGSMNGLHNDCARVSEPSALVARAFRHSATVCRNV